MLISVKYKKNCTHYSRELNKSGQVCNYCKKRNKYMCGVLNCVDCDDYEIKDEEV